MEEEMHALKNRGTLEHFDLHGKNEIVGLWCELY